MYFSLLLVLHTYCVFFLVTLTSSADSVCPGNTVVFTCVTDTGQLAWRSNGHSHFYSTSVKATVDDVEMFTVNLTSVTGMVLVSTATVHNVQLSHNGAVVTCSDGVAIQQDDHSVNGTVQISGSKILILAIVCMQCVCNFFSYFKVHLLHLSTYHLI